jgi:transposase
MSYIQGMDRSQSILFPELIDDYVQQENPVRFIDAYVESLDLQGLGFARALAAETGRPPYAPSDLLKLYIYGYLNKVRSSRQLERLTHRNIEVLWLLRKLHPDFKTIADFRKDNTAGLKTVCREFTLLCKKMDLFGGELVAIDGSKFSAVNHNGRCYTKERLRQMIAAIDERIEGYFTRLDSEDRTEEGQRTIEVEPLQKQIAALRTHKAELEELQKALAESSESQIALTDPDSRMMRTGNQGRDVCYNVQIAVDAKHKLIVASDVTNEETDLHQLTNMAMAAKETLSVETLDVTADKGYFNTQEIQRCDQEKITCYIPEPDKSQNKQLGLYTDRDFRYSGEEDCYVCPANARLTYRGTSTKGKREVKIYESTACKACALREKCTRSKSRRIYRWIDQHIIEELRERMQQHPEIAQKRKTLVEHPFGILKRWMNHDYFLLRGKMNVAAEFSISVLAYNMKRVLNILSVPELIAAVRSLEKTISAPILSLRDQLSLYSRALTWEIAPLAGYLR